MDDDVVAHSAQVASDDVASNDDEIAFEAMCVEASAIADAMRRRNVSAEVSTDRMLSALCNAFLRSNTPAEVRAVMRELRCLGVVAH